MLSTEQERKGVTKDSPRVTAADLGGRAAGAGHLTPRSTQQSGCQLAAFSACTLQQLTAFPTFPTVPLGSVPQSFAFDVAKFDVYAGAPSVKVFRMKLKSCTAVWLSFREALAVPKVEGK